MPTKTHKSEWHAKITHAVDNNNDATYWNLPRPPAASMLASTSMAILLNEGKLRREGRTSFKGGKVREAGTF
jgi:hypothetical protein